MIQIANLSLILAWLCAGYAVFVLVIGLKIRDRRWIKSAANALNAIAGLLTLAVFLLLYFLLQRNFRLEYVAGYTDISLPILYTISALWAGQKGSLLIWGWMLSICSAVCVRSYWKAIITSKEKAPRTFMFPFRIELPYLSMILALILGFFLMLLVMYANPFSVLPVPPVDGQGMNPLLQNPYMITHPPVLFLGYAGFGIPFSLAFAGLCTGILDNIWLRTMRRWILFSWYCLGIGILLGAKWAYVELGWGGYWAWDPVENSSLIPWITSTALLHTVILQQREGLLKRWNIFLSIVTFSLCIFATFITRNGVLESVHAYAQSPSALYFLAFLITVLACTAGLLAYRWKTLQSRFDPTGLISKENSFFLATQLFMGLGFAVLYGTTYPLLSELLAERKAVIDASFFNRVSIPISLIILGLLGVCQLLPWKQISRKDLRHKFLIPSVITLVATILLFVLGIRQFSPLLTCSLGVFVVSPLLINIKRLFRPASLFHLGTVLIFTGIAISSAYKLEKEVELNPGEFATLGHIRFHYVRLDLQADDREGVMFAEVIVYNNEKQIATLTPEKRFYGQPPDSVMTTEVGLHSSLKEDIYTILEGWDEEHRATFLFIIHPMIGWIWTGGFVVFTLGMLFRILPSIKWRG